MKIIIYSKTFGERDFICTVAVIPRIGEKIDMGHLPLYTVVDVVYNLNHNEVKVYID